MAVHEDARAEFLRRLDELHRSDTPGPTLSGFNVATFGDGEQPGDDGVDVGTFSG